jgi:hypothetical protein
LTTPFHVEGHDSGHFYALATIEALFRTSGEPIPCTVVLYFSPSPEYSRYSIQSFDAQGHAHHYARGSDDCDAVDDALLDLWEGMELPAWAWRPVPTTGTEAFAEPAHAAAYARTKDEFLGALKDPGLRRRDRGQCPLRFYDPPPDGFQRGAAMTETVGNRSGGATARPHEEDAHE